MRVFLFLRTQTHLNEYAAHTHTTSVQVKIVIMGAKKFAAQFILIKCRRAF